MSSRVTGGGPHSRSVRKGGGGATLPATVLRGAPSMTKAEGPTRGVGLLSGTHSRMPPPLPACEWGQEGPLPPASHQPLLMHEVRSLTIGKLVSSFQKEIRHSFPSPGCSHGRPRKPTSVVHPWLSSHSLPKCTCANVHQRKVCSTRPRARAECSAVWDDSALPVCPQSDI